MNYLAGLTPHSFGVNLLSLHSTVYTPHAPGPPTAAKCAYLPDLLTVRCAERRAGDGGWSVCYNSLVTCYGYGATLGYSLHVYGMPVF